MNILASVRLIFVIFTAIKWYHTPELKNYNGGDNDNYDKDNNDKGKKCKEKINDTKYNHNIIIWKIIREIIIITIIVTVIL